MKKIGIVLPLIFGVLFASAQQVTISGTISNAKGHTLHFAFVRESQLNNGVYTDTAGNFTLAVNANSKLHINCAGYNDTTLTIGNRTVFSVALSLAYGVIAKPVSKGTAIHNDIVETTFKDQTNFGPTPISGGEGITPSMQKIGIEPNATYSSTFSADIGMPVRLKTFTDPQVDAAQGAIFPVFTVKEETRGSRYLFTSWAHGIVINSKDSLIQAEYYYFNYDKMGGSLLLSQNQKAAIEVYRDMVKSFTLYSEDGEPFVFENVPEIDKNHYVEVVEKGAKYKIYKRINTTFVKSEYETNGITTSGNQYDEYVDKATYFVIGKEGIPH
ncbi:MAG TPA: carboxypeptidase-like regulatory domain-containing protein, partial [Mucilaginibacter sp.]|nr:carboxypeptidase-like regulatory domain-containing protein [Mucilaginibacter sp.]